MTKETYLFIDTETTGFRRKGNLIQDGQGRVCQLAMILTDDVGKSIAEFSFLVKPDNWAIGDGAHKIHGFTDEQCEKYGINQKSMVALYKCMEAKATKKIAHNEDFDSGMMDIECAYYGDEKPNSEPWFCTMKTNSHITGGKWPKLDEALQHYCNRSLGNAAHDAMEDTKACRDIFFAMKGINLSS